MSRHQIQDETECIHHMVEYLNNITQQLVNNFHIESNNIRCLFNELLGKKWVTTPLKDICMAQYNFDQLVMVLNECFRLEREIEKSNTSSKTYYVQLTTHPKYSTKI